MTSLGTFLLSVSLLLGGKPHELKHWANAGELSSFKSVSSRERDPATGEIVQWHGVRLAEVIDEAMAELPLEKKAQVDLIILTSASGAQAFVPRSVVTKFPVLLAQKRERRELPGLQVIVPWTSKPKVLTEEYLPLEDYFVGDLRKVELSSYREHYSQLMLKRRTDPSAMRGEKIFIQNCMGCHASSGKNTLPIQKLADLNLRARAVAGEDGSPTGHPKAPGVRKFKDRDRRAIMSFLDAYLLENSGAQSAAN